MLQTHQRPECSFCGFLQMAGDNLMRVVPAFGAALAGGAADGPRGTTRASAYMDILGLVMVRLPRMLPAPQPLYRRHRCSSNAAARHNASNGCALPVGLRACL